MRTKIILLALVAALSGCMDEGGYDEAGLEQLVDRQANIEDVTDRLGQPDQVINSDGAVAYIYEYERDLLAFTFYNGELLFKERAANDGLYDFKMIKPRAQ
ncbi:conserved hypothetical protein [Vibrio chagasii]|uniref:hypothetical protein n=1 Tax=Vibrio TaxID=662 RepID=UPI000A549D56|nr:MULTISPECIES: hypothetical protein [Vibrio]MDE9381911.1 hypothetical protein [Vibrio alginolyticus]MCG9568561.1 hypothetical protein [Vibrio chagasii]MCG9605907.1 hypothetical protein [Vibrio chagasii]MCG9674822.1 hypothetical protein [Vibrio chagasii]CAH6784986.1 conserved hypothetical protein [Vibrio chagasii]